MNFTKWKIFQAIQFILFLSVVLILFFRKVDRYGAENALEVKLISLAV